LGKNKLRKFRELGTFQHVFQPNIEEILNKDYHLKGKWTKEKFSNNNPIVLELGCGKGEYTVNQAVMHPSKNFIGIDIKGSRIWHGAKSAEEKGLDNVLFIRTRIEFINSFFDNDEIDEIWITFPDPQLKRNRNKKRLTAPDFLNRYSLFLKENGTVHLKTDNNVLFKYTGDLARLNKFEILAETDDLYSSSFLNEKLSIKTYYEKQYLSEGLTINYISFRLPGDVEIIDINE
jgi:tRNA (guanine-N7-)-methyltransferase